MYCKILMIKSNIDWCAKLYSADNYKGVQHFAMVTGPSKRINLTFYEFKKVSSIKVRKGYTLEGFTEEGHHGHGNLMNRFRGEMPSLGQYNDKMASYTCSYHKFQDLYSMCNRVHRTYF